MDELTPIEEARVHGHSYHQPPYFVASRAARPLLVCFSHLRWNFVWQRPQHLLSRAVQQYDVVFIEEPLFEPVSENRLRVETVASGIDVVVPVMAHAHRHEAAEVAQARLIRGYLDARRHSERVFWYYTPAAMAFSEDLDRDLTVYDNMDELSAFKGASPDLLAQEAALLVRADIVFTGGRSLYEAKRHAHENIFCFPSSIDTPHFAAARERTAADPADQAAILRPRIGFFGVVDERFDADLLGAVADIREDWQFVMIGPVVKIDPSCLPHRKNIHWLGHKAYAELPNYLRYWDVGLMPFALNESTRFISPTKTPEFLAAGLRVVSTRIVDVAREYGDVGLVAIADTPTMVVAAIESALGEANDGWLVSVDRHLANGSWDRTWEAMHDAMRNRLEHASAAPVSHEATTLA